MTDSWPTGLVEVGTNAYAYVQEGGGMCVSNAGLIVGPDSCIVIDALFAPSMTQAFQAEIKRVTDKPVRLLVNTHHHIDHTLGNALFPEAQIVSHVNARAELARIGVSPLEHLRSIVPDLVAETEGVNTRLANVTFEGTLTLNLGDREVRLQHLGRGHTIGDIIIMLPDEGIMYGGDLAFHRVTPLAFDGHIGDWLAVCYRIADRSPKTIVPGHGPVGDMAEFRKMSGYLTTIRTQTKAAFDEGKTEEQALSEVDIGEYASWTEPDRLAMNVARLFLEFREDI
ncbi:MAG: MBL fold metallo-hydrolase [Chloroflexi bacterium]|nr:MBL fold metallo-hydrolase [Chloroflexota bacterium]MCI0890524.1 MBL fold metallo-hydrolase [Chloroflexota bacterium]